MAIYGDKQVEDAWHPDDPIPVLLDNLDRRCRDLGEPRGTDIPDTLHLWLENIINRFELLRRRNVSPFTRVRLELLDGDIEYIRLLIGERHG